MADDVENLIRDACQQRDHTRAVTITLKTYGPEILGLLVTLHRDQEAADDAFSLFTERLWTTLDRFELKCSMRTWAYLLARRASIDLMRANKPQRKRQIALSQAPAEVSALVQRVRTQTLSLLAAEKVAAFGELRRQLPEDDQVLLVLRIDRELAWEDLARVFLKVDSPSADDIKRESARLRKRFQLVKDRLRVLGEESGLLRRS